MNGRSMRELRRGRSELAVPNWSGGRAELHVVDGNQFVSSALFGQRRHDGSVRWTQRKADEDQDIDVTDSDACEIDTCCRSYGIDPYRCAAFRARARRYPWHGTRCKPGCLRRQSCGRAGGRRGWRRHRSRRRWCSWRRQGRARHPRSRLPSWPSLSGLLATRPLPLLPITA